VSRPHPKAGRRAARNERDESVRVKLGSASDPDPAGEKLRRVVAWARAHHDPASWIAPGGDDDRFAGGLGREALAPGGAGEAEVKVPDRMHKCARLPGSSRSSVE